MSGISLKFDPNQQFQLDAVESVVRLFEGLPRHVASFTLGDEIVPNLSPHESLREGWLYDNLLEIQKSEGIQPDFLGTLEC